MFYTRVLCVIIYIKINKKLEETKIQKTFIFNYNINENKNY